MGMFEYFKKKEDLVEKTPEQPVEVKKEEYNPKLGETNRFINGPKEFQDKVNEEALSLVRRTLPLLEKIEKQPELARFHDPMAGDQHAIDYLNDVYWKKFEALYGSQVQHTEGVPGEVVSLLERIKKAMDNVVEKGY